MLLATATAWAHHSVIANFDRDTVITLEGIVKAVHLRNPHSQYVLSVKSEDGSVAEWFIEWSDRNALIRRGVDLDLIQPGDSLTVTVWPSRRLPQVGYFVQAALPDGAIYKDCGFLEFRRAVENSVEFRCDEAQGR